MTQSQKYQKLKRLLANQTFNKPLSPEAADYNKLMRKPAFRLFRPQSPEERIKAFGVDDATINEIKEAPDDVITRLFEVMKEARGLTGPRGPKGEKGDKPEAGVDYQIPQDGKPGKDGKAPSVDEIAEVVLAKLKKDKIDASLIKNLSSIMPAPKMSSSKMIHGGGVSESIMVYGEIPSGAVDNVNMTYTLAYQPRSSNLVRVHVNGMRLAVTHDYTISGRTITLDTAPPVGCVIQVDYIKE